MSDAIKALLGHYCFDRRAFAGGAAFQSVNHRHRDFAFTQITGYGLAENALRCSQIEHIIHDLECHPQIAPVLRQILFLLRSRSPEDCSHPHAG